MEEKSLKLTHKNFKKLETNHNYLEIIGKDVIFCEGFVVQIMVI